MKMETVDEIIEKFVKELKEMGCVNWAIAVGDPDSHMYYRNYQGSSLWRVGVGTLIIEDSKDEIRQAYHGNNDDDDDD